MTFAITAPYAAALTLLFVILTQMVIVTRTRQKVGLGDGGNPAVLAAMRRQANFVENVPLTLIVMALAEAGGAGVLTLNICGAALLLARIIHPFGLQPGAPSHPARIVGGVITAIVQVALVIVLALQHFA